jgi:hypothetical protein
MLGQQLEAPVGCYIQHRHSPHRPTWLGACALTFLVVSIFLPDFHRESVYAACHMLNQEK